MERCGGAPCPDEAINAEPVVVTVARGEGCIVVMDGCTVVTDGCTVVTDGCTVVVDGCTVVTDGCIVVTDGCTVVVDGCTVVKDGAGERVRTGEYPRGEGERTSTRCGEAVRESL